MPKLETKFQKEIIDELRNLFPGCIILKNDANYLQGIPDTSIFIGDFYAFLEVKREYPRASDYRPNQEYYIELLNNWSFAAMICPENKDEVLRDLQHAYRSSR